MRIAIVCGHFVPTLGYVEVHLANAYQRLGYTVKVITSNTTSSSAKFLELDKSEENLKYDLVRLKTWFSYGQIVRSKGITKEIHNFNPDKVIVIGLGKIFPKEVFKVSTRNYELITLLGDNETNHYKSEKNLKRRIMQTFFKTPVYELAIKKSDKLVGYTPSTKHMVDASIHPKLIELFTQKYSTTSLGFDETEFNYDENLRLKTRKELGIEERELVLITATRITSAKKIERIIDRIAVLSNKGIRLKYVIIGFTESKYCQELRNYIIEKDLGSAVIDLPFATRNEMNGYYNMADLGLWTRASISIFEGLATGLTLLLPDRKNVSHILTANNGLYYTEENLLNRLEECVSSYDSTSKATVAKTAKAQFSFNVIAQKLINK